MTKQFTIEVNSELYESFQLALLASGDNEADVIRKMISEYTSATLSNAAKRSKDFSGRAVSFPADKVGLMKEIRIRSRQSWANLRRAVYKDIGMPYSFGTPNVEASSTSFLNKIERECGFTSRDILRYLDENELGLATKEGAA